MFTGYSKMLSTAVWAAFKEESSLEISLSSSCSQLEMDIFYLWIHYGVNKLAKLWEISARVEFYGMSAL